MRLVRVRGIVKTMDSSSAPQPVVITLPYGDSRDEDFSKAIAEYKQGKAVGSQSSNLEDRLLEELFLRYPTVYIVSANARDSGKKHSGGSPYVVYVGETNDIRSRTRQHIELDPRTRTDWERLVRFMRNHHDRVCQYIIGDRHFNKSLTLDMENRLMGYMQSVDSVKLVMNRRTNAQDMYYTSDEFDNIFSKAWQTLHEMEPDLFPEEKAILDSALFKASPFRKLTDEQRRAEEAVLHVLESVIIQNRDEGFHSMTESTGPVRLNDKAHTQVIVVQGMSGTGKTVLLSHLFYQICARYGIYGNLNGTDDNHSSKARQRSYIIVNQAEQANVYNQMALKLGLQKKRGQCVVGAVQFINRFSKHTNRNGRSTGRAADPMNSVDAKADVVLIDEAHLLLTQGSQSYSGSNQLYDILRRAKVAIVVFDPEQVLRGSQFVDAQERRLLGLTGSGHDEAASQSMLIREKSRDGKSVHEDTFQVSHVRLDQQMRIQADPATCAWLDRMTAKDGVIGPLRPDPQEHPYEIKVFDSPKDLRRFIRQKDQEQRAEGSLGLCRLLATYDWPYSSKNHPDPRDPSRHWQVILHQEGSGQWVWAEEGQDGEGEFAMPWNYELYDAQGNSAANHRIAWAELPFTIDEVGSIFTIQGFDLNYAGVIIGPSVTYRNGKVEFKPKLSCNTLATNQRSEPGMDPVDNLRHEFNVLLKRGVHGLGLFAVDSELRDRLAWAVGGFAQVRDRPA